MPQISETVQSQPAQYTEAEEREAVRTAIHDLHAQGIERHTIAQRVLKEYANFPLDEALALLGEIPLRGRCGASPTANGSTSAKVHYDNDDTDRSYKGVSCASKKSAQKIFSGHRCHSVPSARDETSHAEVLEYLRYCCEENKKMMRRQPAHPCFHFIRTSLRNARLAVRTTPDTIEKFIREDVELLGKFKAALTRPVGAPLGNQNARKEEESAEQPSNEQAASECAQENEASETLPVDEEAHGEEKTNPDNIRNCFSPSPPPPSLPPAERGTSRSYSARRLQKDAPAIFKRVRHGTSRLARWFRRPLQSACDR